MQMVAAQSERDDELHRLRDRVEMLEAEFGLKQRVVFNFPLTQLEQQILRVLLKRDRIGREGLFILIWGHLPDCDQPETINVVDVAVSKLRKKLSPKHIEIETIWGDGFRLTSENKSRLRELIT